MPKEELPEGDPRILESPVEAGMELAELVGRRLPSVKLRSVRLLSLGTLWSCAVLLMAGLAVLSLWDSYEAGLGLVSVRGLAYITLTLLFVPSAGLGLALVMLAFKERQFLPFLEKSSGAMTALEGRPPAGQGAAGGPADGAPGGGSLAGILGSAISVGSLVPTAERMAVVARGVLLTLLLGLGALAALVAAGSLLGTFPVTLVSLELVVLVVLVYPALALFGDLSADLGFYRYYSRRHRAIAEAAATGLPAVPGGADPLARFDRYLRSLPAVRAMMEAPGASVEDGPEGATAARLYFGRGMAVLVRLFERAPDRAALESFMNEAGSLAKKRGLSLSRAVALVAPGGQDLDNATYDHILEMGERTLPGGCALQLVMEVDGAYSMVPFVSS